MGEGSEAEGERENGKNGRKIKEDRRKEGERKEGGTVPVVRHKSTNMLKNKLSISQSI